MAILIKLTHEKHLVRSGLQFQRLSILSSWQDVVLKRELRVLYLDHQAVEENYTRHSLSM